MGFKTEMKDALTHMATSNIAAVKDRMLEELAHPEVQQEWMEAFRHRLRRKEKDSVRLYPELLKMIGPENSISMLIVNRYGCSSEDELAGMVDQWKQAASLTDEQRFERCMQFAQQFLKLNPERVPEAISRLKALSAATVEA